MTLSRSILMLTTAFVFAAAPALAQSPSHSTDPGFIPDTGQINPGNLPPLPSAGVARKIPSQEEARAALMMPDPGTISAGVPLAATTGAAPSEAAATGPIGATLQTMPAKFSHRNDVLDRVPIMAWPLKLDDQQRRQVYQAVMAEKTQAAPGAEALAPTGALTFEQTLAMRPLPASLQAIDGLKGLSYVKAKDKVLLVQPDNGIVVDQIAAS